MKILLLGEYSRLHLTLAEGLRILGHEVTVASDGDGFKNFERDVDLTRRSSGLLDTATAILGFYRKVSSFKDFDVVQLINPNFTTLNASFNEKFFWKLKKNNKKIFLGAFGDDSFWLKACIENKTFRYSEFWIDGKPTNLDCTEKLKSTWVGTAAENLNKLVAKNVDGIAACLYEYYESYKPYYYSKLKYLPLPINIEKIPFVPIEEEPDKVNFFIGINKDRTEVKGTDIMEKALIAINEKYPESVNIIRAESLSYAAYQDALADSHVVLDQLYSFSPAVNALQAMARGKIAVSGGEQEIYDLLGEMDNQPIVNVYPSFDGVFEKLEWLVLNKKLLPKLSRDSRVFVEEHHDYLKIAKQYLDFWTRN